MIQYKSGATLYNFYRLLPIVGGSAIFCWHTFLHGALAAGLSVLYAEAELPEKAGIQHPTIFFGGISTSLAFLLVFRANLSYQRYWEAATQVALLSTKLRDVAFQVATFVQSNEGNAVSWKSTQLRRIALYFRLALLELRDNSSADSDLVAAVDEGVLNPDERDVLLKTSDRASLVMLWLIDAWVTRNKLENGIDVPAPVLTRSFQLLSEASVGRDMLGKIQNTPFPFPFVQVCSYMLVIWCVTLPLLTASFVESRIFGAVLSFLGVGALFSINGIASELEDPFDDTPNDLALEYHVSNFTDFMTELMCWLGEKSDGNVKGALELQPSVEPWKLVSAQVQKRDEHVRLNRLQLHVDGRLRGKDSSPTEFDTTANPQGGEGERTDVDKYLHGPSVDYETYRDQLRLRIKKHVLVPEEVVLSSVDAATKQFGAFWLH